MKKDNESDNIFNKICSTCKEYVISSKFNKNKNTVDGLQAVCKDCEKIYRERKCNKEKAKKYQAEYRQSSTQYQKDYQSNYRKENPEYQKNYRKMNKDKLIKYVNGKIKKFGKTKINKGLARYFVTLVYKQQILERDNFSCVMCSKMLSYKLVIHHILPVKISPDKILDLDNLVSLCRKCHIIAHGGHFRNVDKVIAKQLQDYIKNFKETGV